MKTPDQLVANIFDQHQPKTLLLLGNSDLPAVTAFLDTHTEVNPLHQTISQETSLHSINSRFDVCLITPEFIELKKQSAIGIIRDTGPTQRIMASTGGGSLSGGKITSTPNSSVINALS